MAARWDGSLIQPKADGRPGAALSLQDKALLRKYSISGPSDGMNTAANARLVQNERHELTIRSEGSQRSEDILKVDQTDPTVFDSIARSSADPLVPIPSSVPKDWELPTSGEADPKRRRRIGKAGIKKEPREDGEGASNELFGSVTKFVPTGTEECEVPDSYLVSKYSAGYSRLLHCTKVWRYRHGSIVYYIGLGPSNPGRFSCRVSNTGIFFETFVKTFHESSSGPFRC